MERGPVEFIWHEGAERGTQDLLRIMRKFICNGSQHFDDFTRLGFSFCKYAYNNYYYYSRTFTFLLAMKRNTTQQGSISSTCLCAAFRLADPKKTKKLLDLTVFFALLGSAGVKAACKMMVKLTLVSSIFNVSVLCDPSHE